jgi:hypothetical protein
MATSQMVDAGGQLWVGTAGMRSSTQTISWVRDYTHQGDQLGGALASFTWIGGNCSLALKLSGARHLRI